MKTWIAGLWFWLKENPVVVWNLSSAQTMATSAFPLSILYPNWARDMAEHAPLVWDATKEVVLHVFHQGL